MTLAPCRRLSAAGSAVAAASLVACSIAAAQPAAARSASAPHVRVELIADRDRPQAGTQWLGVRFTLDPGWHIYWQNPGDSGGPPEVQWHTPAGMAAAPFEWPVPQRIEVDGLVNYGYQNTVVLPVALTVSAGAPASPAVIGASLRWLLCRDICVSGRASLALRWPLDEQDRGAVASWAEAIGLARALVPRPAPSTWTVSAAAGRDAFTLDVRTGQRERQGAFFPLEAGQVDDSAPQAMTPIPSGIRFDLRKSPQLMKNPATLRGVVSFPDGRACVIAAAVSR